MSWEVILSVCVVVLAVVVPSLVGRGGAVEMMAPWRRKHIRVPGWVLSALALSGLAVVSYASAQLAKNGADRAMSVIQATEREDDARDRASLASEEREELAAAARRELRNARVQIERLEARVEKEGELMQRRVDFLSQENARLRGEEDPQRSAHAQQLDEIEESLSRLSQEVGAMASAGAAKLSGGRGELEEELRALEEVVVDAREQLAPAAVKSPEQPSVPGPLKIHSWVGMLSGGGLSTPLTVTLDKVSGPRRPEGAEVQVSIVEWGLNLSGRIRSVPRLGSTARVTLQAGPWSGKELRLTLPGKTTPGAWTLYRKSGDRYAKVDGGILQEENP